VCCDNSSEFTAVYTFLFFMCSVFEGLSLVKFMPGHYMWFTLIYSCFGLWCYETVLLVGRHYQFGETLLTIHQEYGVITQKTTVWIHATVKSSDLYTILVSCNWTHNTVLSSSNYCFVIWWFLKGLVLIWLLRSLGLVYGWVIILTCNIYRDHSLIM